MEQDSPIPSSDGSLVTNTDQQLAASSDLWTRHLTLTVSMLSVAGFSRTQLLLFPGLFPSQCFPFYF